MPRLFNWNYADSSLQALGPQVPQSSSRQPGLRADLMAALRLPLAQHFPLKQQASTVLASRPG